MLEDTKDNLVNDDTASNDRKVVKHSDGKGKLDSTLVMENLSDSDNHKTVVLNSEGVQSTSTNSLPKLSALRGQSKPHQVESNESDKTVIAKKSSGSIPTNRKFESIESDATVIASNKASSDRTVISTSAKPSQQYERKPIGAGQSVPAASEKASRVIRNRFELKSLLGEGGMGSVWSAVDRRKIEANDLNPYVAVKLLNEDFKKHPDAFISLQRETQKSQTLAHPNIVTVYDFDRDGETVFMTMEYLQGAPLDVLLRESSGAGLDREQALGIIKDISSALIYAHSHGIIHSDFKPGNIFVSDSGNAKVLDFGIARVAAETSGNSQAGKKPFTSDKSSGDTTQGNITHRTQDTYDAGALSALTPSYASYEMFERQDPDPSDDVYALACVAYEMLTGRHPYNRKPANKKNLPDLQRIDFLTRGQWQALEKALRIHRSDRTATVDEFVSKFFKKRTNPLVYFAVASLITAIGSGAYYQIQKRETDILETARISELAAVEQQKFESIQQQLKRRFSDQELDRSILRDDWKAESEVVLAEYAAFDDHEAPIIDNYRYSASNKFLDLARVKLDIGDLSEADLEFVAENIMIAGNYISEARYWSITNSNIDSVIGLKAIAEQSLQSEDLSRNQAEDRRLLAIQREEERVQKEAENREYQRQLNLDRTQLLAHFECQQDLDVSGIPAVTFSEFQNKYPREVAAVEQTIVNRTASCIQQVAKRNPIKASRILTASAIVFPTYANSFTEIVIDYCGHVRTGSGRPCRDPSSSIGRPPLMVVVPSAVDIDVKIAVSRYEVSNKDVSYFCEATSKCNLDSNDFPATGINVGLIVEYTQWLTELTGFNYRLPTIEEWQAAARGRDDVEDPNRNCYLRFNGIVKGESLVTVDTGNGNDYGLVNYSGNAQEIVKSGSDYKVVGGSIKDPMSRCTVETVKDYKGEVDLLTGFRVVRLVN